MLEWDADTRAEGNRLQDEWRERADELQAAIEEHGQEAGQGYEYRQALRKAARAES